jgi:hypothetical protein
LIREGVRPPRPDVGSVEPADNRLEPEQLGVRDQRQRDVVRRRVRLDAGIALHDLDRVPPVDLQDLVDVDLWDLQGDQHLDHELVPWWRHEFGRGAQPAVELLSAGRRDPVALLRTPAVRVGLDEPVALESLQRRVDLPDVQRPDLARPRLELVLQLQAVLGPVAEQGEEGVRDAHKVPFGLNILSFISSILLVVNQLAYGGIACWLRSGSRSSADLRARWSALLTDATASSASAQQPPPDPELRRLEPLVGTWRSDGHTRTACSARACP